MNISKYDFHDGCLIDIENLNDCIVISMESAEISEQELDEYNDNIILSYNNTIKGKLHIEKVKKILVNNEHIRGKLRKKYEEGDIYRFKVIENKLVKITVIWINHSTNPYENTDHIQIEIEAENVYWENIPDLYHP